MFHSKTAASRGDVQLPAVAAGQPRAQLPGETVRQQGEGRSGTSWGRRQGRHHSLWSVTPQTLRLTYMKVWVCVWSKLRSFLNVA